MKELDFKYRMSNETEQPNIGKNLDDKKKYKKNSVKKDKEKSSGWILKKKNNKNKIKRNNEENDFKQWNIAVYLSIQNISVQAYMNTKKFKY